MDFRYTETVSQPRSADKESEAVKEADQAIPNSEKMALLVSEAIAAHRTLEDYSTDWRSRIPEYELVKSIYKEDIGYSSTWFPFQNPEKGFQFEYPSD